MTHAVDIPTDLANWTLAAIEALLLAGCFEDRRFDWKEMIPPGDGSSFVKGCVAMANAGGGFIIIGVSNSGAPLERIKGIPPDQEFAASIANQLGNADPPVPFKACNPPLELPSGRHIYVLQIFSHTAPHAYKNTYLIRSDGGTARQLTTYELGERFAASKDSVGTAGDILLKCKGRFLRHPSWTTIHADLVDIAHYAESDSAAQRNGLLGALSALAVRARSGMPRDLFDFLVELIATARPRKLATPADREALEEAIEALENTAHAARKYRSDELDASRSEELLHKCLAVADKYGLNDLVQACNAALSSDLR